MAPAGRHALCGFVLHAMVPLFGLPDCPVDDGPLGRILLRQGDVPAALDGSPATLRFVQIARAELLIDIPQAGRMLVRDGAEIVIAPARDATQSLQPYILGVAMGAICLQRGHAPLHASAVSNGAGTIAFAGESGAGKSTMAVAMADHGYTPLTDDLALIVRDGVEPPGVYPGSPLVRLWPNSVEALQLDRSGSTVELAGSAKLLFSLGAGDLARRPLSALYFLERDDGDAVAIEPMRLPQAIAAFARDLYRGHWALPMGAVDARLAAIGHIVSGLPCFRLRRPHAYSRLSATAAAVARHQEAWAAAQTGQERI